MPAAVTDDFAAENDPFENLKQAPFQAFVAAPKTGIPTALVDLAATYTSALRLQMTLKRLRVRVEGIVQGADVCGGTRDR